MRRTFVAGGLLCILLSLSACSESPSKYYPLGKGRTWTYQVSIKMPFGQEQTATLKVAALEPRQLRDRTVLPEKYEISGAIQSVSFFQYVIEGEDGPYLFAEQQRGDVEPKVKDAPEYLLKQPLKVGNSWPAALDLGNGSSVSGKATIQSTDEVVDVPAGTFKNCVKVVITSSDKGATGKAEYQWYAPSVGLIRDISEAEGTIQLASFTK